MTRAYTHTYTPSHISVTVRCFLFTPGDKTTTKTEQVPHGMEHEKYLESSGPIGGPASGLKGVPGRRGGPLSTPPSRVGEPGERKAPEKKRKRQEQKLMIM